MQAIANVLQCPLQASLSCSRALKKEVPVEALPLEFCADRLPKAGLRAQGWDAVLYVQESASCPNLGTALHGQVDAP
jgi:hypothetical protein